MTLITAIRDRYQDWKTRDQLLSHQMRQAYARQIVKWPEEADRVQVRMKRRVKEWQMVKESR